MKVVLFGVQLDRKSTLEATVSAPVGGFAAETPATTAGKPSRAYCYSRIFFCLTLFLSSCATKDADHHSVVSARDQKLALLEKGQLVATYPISTSKYGLGDAPGSYRTP